MPEQPDVLPAQSEQTVEPSAGVIAVAELLRQRYLSEHETTAPVSDWYPEAIELVAAYFDGEGLA